MLQSFIANLLKYKASVTIKLKYVCVPACALVMSPFLQYFLLKLTIDSVPNIGIFNAQNKIFNFC